MGGAIRIVVKIKGIGKLGKGWRIELELKGAAGLSFDFEAGTPMDASATLNNVGKEIALPVDFSISGLAVPFAVTLKQAFLLKTAFSAKTASLTATADYGLRTASKWVTSTGSGRRVRRWTFR